MREGTSLYSVLLSMLLSLFVCFIFQVFSRILLLHPEVKYPEIAWVHLTLTNFFPTGAHRRLFQQIFSLLVFCCFLVFLFRFHFKIVAFSYEIQFKVQSSTIQMIIKMIVLTLLTVKNKSFLFFRCNIFFDFWFIILPKGICDNFSLLFLQKSSFFRHSNLGFEYFSSIYVTSFF